MAEVPVSRRTVLGAVAAAVATAGVCTGPARWFAPRPVAGRAALRGLLPIIEGPVSSIADVAQRLAAVRDHMSGVSELGELDGIACFSRLYAIITETVDARPFADREFLVRLDLEFARRYFDALLAHVREPHGAPDSWRVLFDRRIDASVGPARFAAAGVNAHINYDLAAALLATWPDFPPIEPRHGDYDGINEVFAARMEQLRELFDSPLSGGPGLLDAGANRLGDLLVRATRTLAWDLAMTAWTAPDRAAAATSLDCELDRVTAMVGRAVLDSPVLPL